MAKKLPEAPEWKEPEWLFPFASMSVGDSFFIPTMRPAHMIHIITDAARKSLVRVEAFPRHENGVLGVRTWRMG